ncbi:MAG TPA: chemotaxis protein CheD [Spirochaetota bacterium]|nr:chemotaxis protein CheD [Spirochaetota bacterium]HPS87339.1 chemotaxis protein CheD [Spirochaetota bacterium]
MHVHAKHKLGKNLNIIYPGEYYITNKDELIGTLLGSCVSVCLHDPENKIGGMNHFMLPGKISKADIFSDDNARYGIASINKIVSEIVAKGASKNHLTAKIFGGGNIIKFLNISGKQSLIPSDNIRVAKLFMEIEDIPIVALDVGEDYTRKIIFDVSSGKVYLRKFKGGTVNDIVIKRDEEALIHNIEKQFN